MLRRLVRQIWRDNRDPEDQWELDALDVHWYFQMFSALVGFITFVVGYLAVYFVEANYYSLANTLNLTCAVMTLIDVILMNRMVNTLPTVNSNSYDNFQLWAWMVRWLMRRLPLWFPFLPSEGPMTGLPRELIKVC